MSEMSKIYSALMAARRSNDALETWVTSTYGRDIVSSNRRAIEDGISAYETLSTSLRDGRKHIEAPDYFKATECMCSWPTVSAPCSWCTDPDNFSEDE